MVWFSEKKKTGNGILGLSNLLGGNLPNALVRDQEDFVVLVSKKGFAKKVDWSGMELASLALLLVWKRVGEDWRRIYYLKLT